jgi:hypothetical protein
MVLFEMIILFAAMACGMAACCQLSTIGYARSSTQVAFGAAVAALGAVDAARVGYFNGVHLAATLTAVAVLYHVWVAGRIASFD